MSNEAEPDEKTFLLRSLSLSMGVLAVYVLSIGPVALSCKKNGIPDLPTAVIIYYPLVWLHEHTILAKPLEAYVALWVND